MRIEWLENVDGNWVLGGCTNVPDQVSFPRRLGRQGESHRRRTLSGLPCWIKQVLTSLPPLSQYNLLPNGLCFFYQV